MPSSKTAPPPTESMAMNRGDNNSSPVKDDTRKTATCSLDDDFDPLTADFAIHHNLTPAELTLGPIIGHGAFSTVYSATYQGKEVALKRQTKDTHILRELAILQQIDHPHLLKYIGSCEYEHMGTQEVWIVSEFYKGGDVSKLLKRKKSQRTASANSRDALTWLQCVQIALDAAEALAYLHERHIIHRDVKSANILLDADLRCRLCDFGFARKQDRDHEGYSSDEHTGGGRMRRKMSLCGTDAYMSPEMYFNEDYNDRADIYSFGVVLMELICRREVNKDDFLMRVPAKNFVIDPEEFHAHVPADCPPSLVLLADNCTHFEPDGRPSSHEAVEWLADLKKDLVEAAPAAEDEVQLTDDESVASAAGHDWHEDEETHVLDASEPPTYEGALLVRNCVGRWRQRYVVVRDSSLVIYKSHALFLEVAQLEADGHQKIKHRPAAIPLAHCQLIQVTPPPTSGAVTVFGLQLDLVPTFLTSHRVKKKARRWTVKSKGLAAKFEFQAASTQEMQLWVALFVRAIKIATHIADQAPADGGVRLEDIDTTDEVYQWLASLGLKHYFLTFKEKGFATLDFVRETGLGEDDFNFLGIDDDSERDKLARAALVLRGEA